MSSVGRIQRSLRRLVDLAEYATAADISEATAVIEAWAESPIDCRAAWVEAADPPSPPTCPAASTQHAESSPPHCVSEGRT